MQNVDEFYDRRSRASEAMTLTCLARGVDPPDTRYERIVEECLSPLDRWLVLFSETYRRGWAAGSDADYTRIASAKKRARRRDEVLSL